MLRPQTNTHRDARDLSGVWKFRVPDAGADTEHWRHGVPDAELIAVPGSWNEQLPAHRDHCGDAWYQTDVEIAAQPGRRLGLRFGSVNYAARVWVNGELAGNHTGGHLPFELEVTELWQPGRNRIVVHVDNHLAADRVPPGHAKREAVGFDLGKVTDLGQLLGGMFGSQPSLSADFFPFGGIHRPVHLTSVALHHITGIRLRETDPHTGSLVVDVDVDAPDGSVVSLRVGGANAHGTVRQSEVRLALTIPDVVAWAPDNPHLYDAEFELHDGADVCDRYVLPIGMRSVKVDGDRLLLNGKPVVMTGFGRHEDYVIIGRGHFPAGNVRDYAMMRWMGANSFRTSHYPYSEEQLDLADRLGFLVISETPAVGLTFGDEHEAARLSTCLDQTAELIERDRNRPSVIMWSLANEPMTFQIDPAVDFFRTLVDRTRTLDDRPLTIVNPLARGEAIFEMVDVIGLNRYAGWYSDQGDIAGGTATLARELDRLHAKHGKPIMVTEFGCDTLPGHHADPPEMWSEEYQADFLEAYIRMMNERPFIVAQHVWNLADFKTGQGVLRAGSMNHKGVLTRDRRPKLAAHRLRQLWGG